MQRELIKKIKPFKLKRISEYLRTLEGSGWYWGTPDVAGITHDLTTKKKSIMLMAAHEDHQRPKGLRDTVTHEVVEMAHKTRPDEEYTPDALDQKEDEVNKIVQLLLDTPGWVAFVNDWIIKGFIKEMKYAGSGVLSG